MQILEGKNGVLEKYRMQSDFNGRNLRHIMPHNRHRDAGYYPAKWTKQMAKGRILRGTFVPRRGRRKRRIKSGGKGRRTPTKQPK